MKVDLFSLMQGGRRSISFMSQALGLMAELDIGTDNLRWMGESRFLFGFIRGSEHSYNDFLLLYSPPMNYSLKIQPMSSTTILQNS